MVVLDRGGLAEAMRASMSIPGMRTRAGGPLDLGTLRGDLARLYELGEFERVDFTLTRREGGGGAGEAGQTDLVIRAREKPSGPNYLRFGVNFLNDFTGDTEFNVLARYTRTRMNALGAEWRTDVQVGETRRLRSELYQPLDFSGVFFVAPGVSYTNAIVDVFDGDRQVSEYQGRLVQGILAVGAQLGRYGEARIGASRGRAHARPRVGDPGLPRFDIPIGGWAGRLAIDRLDDANFPAHGRAASLGLYLGRRGLGSDVSYDRLDGGIVQILSRGRHRVLMGLAAGTDLGSAIPFYDEFTLGGLLSLSGFKPDQLRGQVMGVARVGYYRRSRHLSGLVGRGIYVGGWAEAGNVWASAAEVSADSLRYTGTIALGADTFFGPLYLAYGHADGGHNALYLSMGKSLGGPRVFAPGGF